MVRFKADNPGIFIMPVGGLVVVRFNVNNPVITMMPVGR